MSIISLHRSSRIAKVENKLKEYDLLLKEYELEKIEHEKQKKQKEIEQKNKADVKARIYKISDRKYKIKIYNCGEGIAYAISLILELLPLGAVLIFAPSPTERVIHTYSYFDLNLVGYANFSPMLTGILTVAVVILGITILCRYEKAKKRKKAVFVCSVIAFVLSFVPLFMFGSDGMTMISYVISAAMAVSICFQAVANRRELSAA